MPSGLASYLDKYMSIHVPEKDIREKTLLNKPVLQHVMACQRLDEYMKEPLLKNKKSLTLYHEKMLKRIQEKTVPELALLTKLWGFISSCRKKDN